jgi:hypothetical protein
MQINAATLQAAAQPVNYDAIKKAVMEGLKTIIVMLPMNGQPSVNMSQIYYREKGAVESVVTADKHEILKAQIDAMIFLKTMATNQRITVSERCINDYDSAILKTLKNCNFIDHDINQKGLQRNVTQIHQAIDAALEKHGLSTGKGTAIS